MSDIKDLFLKNRELSEQLAAATSADWFKTALTYVDAEVMTSGSPEDIRGAIFYKRILLSIAHSEFEAFSVIPPLLNQNFDAKPTIKNPIKPSTTTEKI